jgi:hypothetical protein
VRKRLCTRHDESDGDSPYEAGDVRRKNSSGATAFHWWQGAPVARDARRVVLQEEKEKGYVRRMVNWFHGVWGGGSPRKGITVALEWISVRRRGSS